MDRQVFGAFADRAGSTSRKTLLCSLVTVCALGADSAANAARSRANPIDLADQAQTTGAGGAQSSSISLPKTGTARIRGRVTVAGPGTPLVRAEVRVLGVPGPPGEAPPSVLTDDQGRYEIANLPAGRFTLTARKSGYLTLSYGQREAVDRARLVDLGSGQVLDTIDFFLPPASVIAVHVDDDLGGPIAGVRVSAERYRYGNGERVLSTFHSAETDDRGDAQLTGVAPGDYFINANPLLLLGQTATLDANDSGLRFAQTYYPGVPVVTDAQRVTLETAESVNISFRLVPVRSVRIAGNVRRSDGSALTQAHMTLHSAGAVWTIPLQPDGSFAISDVRPGKYTINIRPASAVGPQEFGMTTVAVTEAGLTGLLLTTGAGTTVKGSLRFDTGVPPAELWPGSIDIVPTFTGPVVSAGSGTLWNGNWTFEIDRIMGAAVLRARPTPVAPTASGWFLKAVVHNGQDVTDTPFEFGAAREINGLDIVLTQKRTEVRGTVTDARNATVRDYAAVIFADEKERWSPRSRFVAAVRGDQLGSFRITGLPPGKYLAAAVEVLEPGQEEDTDLLERLRSSATEVTLSEGETKSLSLKLTTY